MKVFLLLLLSISLFAENVTSLINKAYLNNPSIQSLTKQIETFNYDIENSTLYKNPVVTIGLNDINLSKPNKRNIEPMQTNYISISQEITNSDKLHYKKQIELSNKKIASLFLEEQKNKIFKTIYSYYFKYNQLAKKITLHQDKIKNIQKIQAYHTNHTEHKKAFQDILNNDLTIDKIKLQIIFNKEKQKQILIEISELVNEEVNSITLSSNNLPNSFTNTINTHTLLEIEKEKLQKTSYKKDLSQENRSSDYTLSGGYYQRDELEDYVSIAIKIPLKFYGKEKNEFLKAKKEISIAQSKVDAITNTLNKKYKLELSKQRLAKQSIVYINRINEHLLKEKELITNKNNFNSLLEVLQVENKILNNQIQKTKYFKELQLANIELAYLTSRLKEISNE